MPVQAGTDPSVTNMSAQPATKDRPIYLLELRPEPGVDPIRALRALLKASLRRYGLRCIAAHESEDKRSCDENCRSR